MVLAETTGTDTIRYLHGLDLVAQSDGVSTEYFAYDGLGSVRQVLGESGLPLMAQTFDPYGNPYRYAGPTESATSFGYSGEQTDSNGLVFLRARYYDPKQGRFFQRDSWRGEPDHPLTLNPYVYGLGNPILYTDPSGHCVFGLDTVICVVVGVMAVSAIIGGAIAYGMYRLALSGACGCELQQWAQSKSQGEVIALVLKAAGIAAVAGPISLAIPDEVLVVAGVLAAGATFQQIEQNPKNACAWTQFVLLTLPLALKTAGLVLRGSKAGTATIISEEISQGSAIYQQVYAKGGVQYGERLYGVAMREGRVIAWLEEGKSGGGWHHIVARRGIGTPSNQFQKFGFTTERQIQEFLLRYAAQSVQEGVEFTGNITVTESATHLLHLEVGDNGFIVTAYPVKATP